MSSSQQKITKYTKQQESMAHSQANKKEIDKNHQWRSPDIGFNRQRL